MAEDYRNTKYCLKLENIKDKKNNVKKLVKDDYPNAVDMHTYISKNDEKYKNHFMRAYNCKCAYCGVSLDLVPKVLFEIDHFLYEKSSRFRSKKYAGYIENLVLACHDCNHKKSSFDISDADYNILYPDGDNIRNTFYRDDKFYIKISKKMEENLTVKAFYDKLQFGSEIHRLDLLLMSLIGFQREHEDNNELYTEVGKTIDILRKKRNMM
jgi:HNH endonuclease.